MLAHNQEHDVLAIGVEGCVDGVSTSRTFMLGGTSQSGLEVDAEAAVAEST